MAEQTINFGIDLGTTNSVIARCEQGQVEVFKNPTGHKETLPSVVGFRKERILVGDKAREYVLTDARSVVGSFKRKMGTTESFPIESLGQSKTPVELSAIVLKELRGFIHTGEPLDAAVITIPASFDTVQSNATKQAGEQAGLRQVVLLQEPIAASLAYANKKSRTFKSGSWLVYDLGGGTFDVALVRIGADGDLMVADHEGNNYLGGSDFDQLIAEQILVPKLEKAGEYTGLITELKSRTGRWNALWEKLLFLAEKAKVELSHATSAELDLTARDDRGEEIDLVVETTRSELEKLVQPLVDRTVEMVRTVITRNHLQPADLQFILMVGGATLMPYVRRRVEECVGVPVVCDIDPTTAIAVGAAYFAAGRPKEAPAAPPAAASTVQVKAVYPKTTREGEEIFHARVSGAWPGCHYRIRRQDGGFDTGWKELRERISDDLAVLPDAYNVYSFQVTDANGRLVDCDFAGFQIAHGKFSVAGQLLPEDICIQIDHAETGEARLERLAARNTLLPARSTSTYIVNRTVARGAAEDVLHLIVKEGSADELAESARTVGYLQLDGRQLSRDVPKGTDITVRLEISESRDLKFTVHVEASAQEFTELFAPSFREVPVRALAYESRCLLEKVDEEIRGAVKLENFELAEELQDLKKQVVELEHAARQLSPTDVTDDRYKLDAEKRRCAGEVARLTKGNHFDAVRRDYEQKRARCSDLVAEHGNDREHRHFEDMLKRESFIMESGNARRLEELAEEMNTLLYEILWRVPDFLRRTFEGLVRQQPRMNDQPQASALIAAGRLAVAQMEWDRVREICYSLWYLLPSRDQVEAVKQGFTGLIK